MGKAFKFREHKGDLEIDGRRLELLELKVEFAMYTSKKQLSKKEKVYTRNLLERIKRKQKVYNKLLGHSNSDKYYGQSV